VSFGDRKESAEAASLLPQASALLPGAEFVAGCGRRRWGSGTLLQPPEDLGSTFLVQIHTDQLASVIVQRPVAPTILPDRHTVSPLWKWGRVCALPLLTLLTFAPGAISELVRAVPAFALGARCHGAMLGALWCVVCGMPALGLEPLACILDLRLDASKVCTP